MNGKDKIEDKIVEEWEEKFHKAINDDLNMPAAMSIVWEVVRQEKKSPKLANLLARFDTVLGLKIEEPIAKQQEDIPQEILNLVEERKQARANKDWAKSDQLRDRIQRKGYEIKDSKEGTEIKKREYYIKENKMQ